MVCASIVGTIAKAKVEQMARRRSLNRKIISSNVAEAIKELQKLERKTEEGELREGELQIGLQHAYHHLNFAWNIRHVSTSDLSQVTQAQFEKWGAYQQTFKMTSSTDDICRTGGVRWRKTVYEFLPLQKSALYLDWR